MSQKFINKIAVILSWPREIDLYSNFLKPKNIEMFEFIVNDIRSIEKGRNKSNQLIQELLKIRKINFQLFSEVYEKVKYKAVISTGEVSAYKISLYSITRFIYAYSVGYFFHLTKISNLLNNFFGRPFTAGAPNSIKIGLDWFPEKKIGNISIKFPDGADLKLKNYPNKIYKSVFDIFLSYQDMDLTLVNQKFENKICKKILYFRHETLSKNENKVEIIKEFSLDPQKKIIVWMPSHVDIKEEEDKNILDWSNKIHFLKEFYNLIVRPHPKTLSRNEATIKNLEKNKFIVDNNHGRDISKLIQCSDIVITDYGSIPLECLYLNKNFVFVDMFSESKFVQELIYADSLEIKIRRDLISLQQTLSRSEIHARIKESLSYDYQTQVNKKKLEVFGNNKGLSYIEFINFLKKL